MNMMQEIKGRLDRLERRFCANHHHQTEHRRRANLCHMETKLMLKEFKEASEELLKLLESTTRKTFSDVPIQSVESAPQLEVRTNEEEEIQDIVDDPEIFKKASVVQELDDYNSLIHNAPAFDVYQHESSVDARDQDTMKKKFIEEASCEDMLLVSMKAELQLPSLGYQSSFPKSWLNINDHSEICGTWFISPNLQIDLLDMEPSSTIKIKDANHIFKPGGLDCPFSTHLPFFWK